MKRSRFKRIDQKISKILNVRKTVLIASNDKLGISIYMDIPNNTVNEAYFRVYNNANKEYATRIVLLNLYENRQIPIYFLDKPNRYSSVFKINQKQVDWINSTMYKRQVQYTLFGIYKSDDRIMSRVYNISKNLRELRLIESLIYSDDKYDIYIYPSDIEGGLESFKVYDHYHSKMCRISIREPKYIIPGDDFIEFWNLSDKEKLEIYNIMKNGIYEDIINSYNNELQYYWRVPKLSLSVVPDYTKIYDMKVLDEYPNGDVLYDIAEGESITRYSYVYFSEVDDMSILVQPNEDKSLHYFMVVIHNYKKMRYDFIRISMIKPEYMDTVKSKYRFPRKLSQDELDKLNTILNSDDGYWWQDICNKYDYLTNQGIVFEKPDYTKLSTQEE